jgi:hypothetical protein
MLSNKQQAENFLNLAKDTYADNVELASWQLEVAKVHALLALEEATKMSDDSKVRNEFYG